MNRNDDIERVLEQWFTEGPRHMSDRLFDGTLERIERLPKRRLADLPTRLSAMSLNVRLLAAAAIVVALLGAGVVVLNGVPGVGSHPSETPSASAAPLWTMVDASLMESLISRWDSIGARPIPGSSLTAPIDIAIAPGTITSNGFKGWVASSVVPQVDGSVLLNLTEPQPSLTSQHWTCSSGDQGRYRLALAPDGNTLTLDPMSDACSTRAGNLAGDWSRWPCASTVEFCTADIAPGRQVAVNFKPFLYTGSNGPRTLTGSLSYAVPAGWAVPYVPPTWSNGGYSIFRLHRPGIVAAPIAVWASVHPAAMRSIPNSSPPICSDDSGGAGQTPQSIGTWLATVQGAVASAPVPITIAGLNGVVVDVSLATGFSIKCGSSSQEGTAPPTYDDEPVTTFSGSEGYTVTLDPDVKSRYIILRAADGEILLVQITATFAAFDAVVAEAMPVIETFEFLP